MKLHNFTNAALKSEQKALLLAQIAGIISNVGEKLTLHAVLSATQVRCMANRTLE